MHTPRPTPAEPTTLNGPGLFTAQPATLTLHPADPGSGIRFADHKSPESTVLATPHALTRAVSHPAFEAMPPRNTSIDLPLPDGSTRPLFTIEHLCSALVGLGVHDCLVTVQGPEVPILDGSSLEFVRALQAVGLTESHDPIAPLDPLIITRTITVNDARGGSVTLEPPRPSQTTPTYTYHLDYGTGDLPAALQPSTASWDGTPDDYTLNVAPARTFSLEHEAQQMKALGLFADLTPRDMLVLSPDGPIDNQLRFPNEPARHKLLDLIGDLALTARPLLANVTATKSGHALHHAATIAALKSVIKNAD